MVMGKGNKCRERDSKEKDEEEENHCVEFPWQRKSFNYLPTKFLKI